MAKIRLVKSKQFGVAGEETIAAFEQAVGKLPADFRHFLTKFNGGFPTPDCIEFQEHGRTTASNVFSFHGLHDGPEWASIKWHLEQMDDRLPPSTIPIGHDSFANQWLLSLRKDSFGQIYFWDHGTSSDVDETDLANCPQVSTSFAVFLTQFQEKFFPLLGAKYPSRYEVLQELKKSIVVEFEGFDPQTNAEGIWHADELDENGELSLNYVDYVTHAVYAHTDCYTLLRLAIEDA